jgi:2-polyprenyl-6-methoxyphenol hydroxylase-like FAD-dependent oxidoreductase
MAVVPIGKQAVVVGAGIAGLTAARSLADFFEHVVVLENSHCQPKRPTDPEYRNLGTSTPFLPVGYRH